MESAGFVIMAKKVYRHLFAADINGRGAMKKPKTKIKSIEPNLYVDEYGNYYVRLFHNKRTWQKLLINTTLKYARDEARQFILDKKKEAQGMPTSKSIPSVVEAIELWEKAKKGEVTDNYITYTVKILRRVLTKPLGHIKADKISQSMLRKVVREYNQGTYTKGGTVRNHKPTTSNNLIQCIKSLFTFLVKDDYIKFSPAAKLETFDEPEFKRNVVNLCEYTAFLEEVDKINLPHIRFQLRAMLYLGLRSQEAVDMKWASWNQQTGHYIPGMHGLTKGKEATSLKVPDPMRDWLQMALEQPNKSLTHIYTNPKTGKPYNSKVLRWHLQKISNTLKVKLTPHSLRASYITALSLDHDLATVSKLARHEDIETTMLYVKVDQKRMDSSVKETFSA